MSKIILAITFGFVWTCGLTSAQIPSPAKENAVPEQRVTFDHLIVDKMSHTQVAIRQTRVFLEVYQKEEGEWPDSWVDVEGKFGAAMWESPEIRQSFTKSFVLLRGVPGHINTREEGPYDSTLMMVMAAPIERQFDQDKHELGRWAVWKTFRGQIVTRWHPEPEIISFSAWPDVQSVIAEHSKAVGKIAEPSKAPQPSQSELVEPQSSKASPLPKPEPTTSSEEPKSSTPWSVVAVLIVAAIGLLWLLLKKRK